MDTKILAVCTGARLAAAELYAPHLSVAMSAYQIDAKPLRAAMFLANAGHESGRLTTVVESLNYSVSALMLNFGRHRISEADARAYGRTPTCAADQVAIANCVYGGAWGVKNLGNVRFGDGWLMRGRGLFQSTGRANAARLTARLRSRFPGLAVPDFEVMPEALSLPQWAALSAADFWDGRGLNALADRGDFDGCCDSINLGSKTVKVGDSNGWQERLELFDAGKSALGIAP